MELTDHFSLEEMMHSETAARLGMDNQPGPAELANLRRTAALMEGIRGVLGARIFVHSGYRSPEVNGAVGGVRTSAHCKGLACDFVAQGTDNYKAATRLVAWFDQLPEPVDQLILEYGWIHVGLAEDPTKARRELLTKKSASAPYVQGLVK